MIAPMRPVLRWCLAVTLACCAPLMAQAAAGGYPAVPRVVVLSYCEADAFGAGLAPLMWPNLQRYTTWSEAASWRSAVVVSGYQVEFLSEKKSAARVQVEYQVLGDLSEAGFTPRQGFEKVIFDLARQGEQWKIQSPQLAPHVSVAAAIKYLQKAVPQKADDKNRIAAHIAVLKSHLKAAAPKTP